MVLRLVTVGLGFVLVLAVSQESWCKGSDEYQDVIFVEQPGQRGVYTELLGKIIDLRRTYLILETSEGKRLLVIRDVVQRVQLSRSHPAAEAREWENLVNTYWNREKSPIVAVVQQTVQPLPYVGAWASGLDWLPGNLDTFLASLVLFGLVLYATYRLYDMLVIGRNRASLDRRKSTLELTKLQYEIEGLREHLPAGAEASARLEEDEIRRFRTLAALEVTPAKTLDFLKHKVLKIPTEEEKEARARVWRQMWQTAASKGRGFLRASYYLRTAVNLLATFLTVLFALGSFVDVFLPVAIGESAFVGLFFLALFILSLAVLVRLNTNRNIMRSTFREVLQTGSS